MKNQTTLRTVDIDGKVICFNHTRKKVKNINLRIKVDGSVHISSPLNTSLKYVDNFVERQADFIFASLEKFAKLQHKSMGIRLDGSKTDQAEPLYLKGYAYTVKIHPALSNHVELDEEKKILTIYSTYPQNDPKLQGIVDKWIKIYALTVFTELCEIFYPQLSEYQISMPTIKTRKMKSRWGSCHFTKKTITFADMLIHLPSECIAYVVVHELVHLVVPNHSKDFYDLVEEIMPDWKRRRQLMKDFGRIPSLE